jgi:hypothetical protein
MSNANYVTLCHGQHYSSVTWVVYFGPLSVASQATGYVDVIATGNGTYFDPSWMSCAVHGVGSTGSGSITSFDAGTAANPGLAVINDSDVGLFSPAANTIAVSTFGTERLRIDTAGNVGVGTTAPSATLAVSGTLRIAGTGSETCNSTVFGNHRRNPTTGKLQVCR